MNQSLTAPQQSPIFGVLAAINKGNLVLDLEDAVRQVENAVREQQKKGKITLDLTFEFDSQTTAMKVVADLKVKTPAAPSRASLFFPTPEGNLQRVDPRQHQMFDKETTDA